MKAVGYQRARKEVYPSHADKELADEEKLMKACNAMVPQPG